MSSFHVDDIINVEEQWVMTTLPDCMCTDNYWHDHGLAHAGNDNIAEDECSLDLWFNCIEATSQSQQTLNDDAFSSSCRSMSRAYFSSETGAFRNPSDCEARESGECISFLVESSTIAVEDGYVWRMYGQKTIKNRVHPRCYLKCAQPNCPTKKQTESSSDKQGFILITYFGRHNH